MRTLAVVARKGGSGKTTVAVHLAIAAHLAGHAARLLDTDSQGSAAEVFSQRQGSGPECRATVPVNLVRAQLDARAEGIKALFIDTPASSEEAMSTALVLADLAVLVVRPTFLDLAGAVQTAAVLKRLRKPSLILLNQAPPTRSGVEPPAVRKALEALQLIGLPVLPVILRARAGYQTAMASGRSALEAGAPGGAVEMVHAWEHIARLLFPRGLAHAAPLGQPATTSAPTPVARDAHAWAEHALDLDQAVVSGAPGASERVVIQNWKGEPDFVTVGDVEVELEPGQEVTLWVRRGKSAPNQARREAAHLPGLMILAEDEALIA